MKATTMMKKAPVDWEKTVDRMNTQARGDLRRELEGISARAAMLAGYLDQRHGYGCGDQGHKKAVKRMNRHGKMVWMKVFGYNAHHDINI
ncbi:hypothetical protein LCGC14_1484360 [marine sediment metagenome]|uniref:Uncharacterized protein n=1 Tax=marine sediment metagenome TaxID=412755 RepID=A0A0F9J968_9ZZZZ|nr:hypothetical protein [Desulfobacterales bacterium]